MHGQDIRRALGLSATFDPEHLLAIGNVAQKWYTWGARKRRLSQRLEATDAERDRFGSILAAIATKAGV